MASGLTHKHLTRLERACWDKWSSLIWKVVTYSLDKFYKIGPHVVKILIYIYVLFIFSKPVFIRHLWQLKAVVLLHRCLINALLFQMHFSSSCVVTNNVVLKLKNIHYWTFYILNYFNIFRQKNPKNIQKYESFWKGFRLA